MLYKYNGKNDKGDVSGLVDAASEKHAISLLRTQNIYVISLKKKKGSFSLGIKRISFNDIVNFTQQLSTMITAGLTLTDSLNILKQQSRNQYFIKILNDITKEIEGGSSFSKALEAYPDCFSSIYISLIKAGEASGKIKEVLERLTANLEKQRDFVNKTKAAMVYPSIILIGMSIVMFLMMTLVIPKMTEFYKDFDSELPVTTQIMISISNIFVKFWWLMILVIWVLVYFFRKWKKTEIGKHTWDELILKVPIWGSLKKSMIFADFTRTFGILVGSGIPILEALEIVSNSIDNSIYQDDIKNVAKQVEKGLSIGIPMSNNTRFPPIVSQMVTVGEETGKLDETLLKISIFFEIEAEQGVKALTSSMEPIIMVVLGLGVGFIILSIIMPIYSLTSKL
ncbi:MAG: type II secretion system F family protein [Actinobacteria bacterium]|nr:type II secretion system F family protein [Actinomycetota bacterium]